MPGRATELPSNPIHADLTSSSIGGRAEQICTLHGARWILPAYGRKPFGISTAKDDLTLSHSAARMSKANIIRIWQNKQITAMCWYHSEVKVRKGLLHWAKFIHGETIFKYSDPKGHATLKVKATMFIYPRNNL